MNSCIKMVHDELEDFATPFSAVYPYEEDDEYVYDNDKYNNESSDSDDDSEMDYNYDGDDYFY